MSSWWLLLLLSASTAVRIPLNLDNSAGPFLQSSSTASGYSEKMMLAPFRWNRVYLGKLLHTARLVEIGPRGALFIIVSRPAWEGRETVCRPSPEALCMLEEGLVLPSATRGGDWALAGKPSLLKDPVLLALATAGDACEGNLKGQGRAFNGSNYTVTACDVVRGSHLLVYEPHTGRLSVHRMTFGPMAYLVVLISATLHICALAPSLPQHTWLFQSNVVLSVLACLVLYCRGLVAFHLLEDVVFLCVSGVLGLGYLALQQQAHQEPYLHALSMIAAVLYRTHETPYAPILGYMLAFLTWGKLFKKAAWWDVLLSVACASTFCEIALRPQCMFPEIWPLYYMFHLFITFCLAKYQDLCWIPTP